MIQNYKDLSAEQLRAAMIDAIPSDTFGEGGSHMKETPDNINWMFVVYNIETAETADDLREILNVMNHHYAGPISIHEGWGGCEADSNLELITEKLRFDMGENPDCLNVNAYVSAVELGWLSFEEIEECFGKMSYTYRIGGWGEDRADRLYLSYSKICGELRIRAYGHEEKRHLFVEDSQFEISESIYKDLLLALGKMNTESEKARYVRAWANHKGFPLVAR